MEATIEKFWLMNWEQNCGFIVMLCPLAGTSSKEESTKYWLLENAGETKTLASVGIQITLEKVKQVTSGLIKRTFRLRNIPSSPDSKVEDKVVIQL